MMKKFYWLILMVCFFYGCSTSQPVYTPVPRYPTTDETPQSTYTAVPRYPMTDEEKSTESGDSSPQNMSEKPYNTETGKAVVDILCKEGRLSSEECD